MPTFHVELDDGRKFQMEADSEPSHEEVLSALGYGQQTTPEQPQSSAAGAFARGVGSKAGRGAGALAGALYGAAALSEFGPPGMAIGGIGGAILGGAGGEAVQEDVQGQQYTEALKQQVAVDQQQHEGWSNAGGMLADLPSAFVAPESKLLGIGGKVVNAAIAGGVMSGGEAGGGAVSGENTIGQIPGKVFQGGVTFAPSGFIPGAGNAAGEIAGNAYKYLGRPLADAATLGASGVGYNAATGQGGSLSDVVDQTGKNIIPFLAVNAAAGLLHGHAKPLEGVKENGTVPHENVPTEAEQPAVEEAKPSERTGAPIDLETGAPADANGIPTHGQVAGEVLPPRHSGDTGALPSIGETAPPGPAIPPPADGGGTGGNEGESAPVNVGGESPRATGPEVLGPSAPQPEPVAPGGETILPNAGAPVRKVSTAAFLEEAGLPPHNPAVPFTREQAKTAADAIIARTPQAVNSLVDELLAVPRDKDPVETQMMRYAMADAKAKNDQAAEAKRAADKTGDVDKITAARARYDQTRQRYGDVIRATKESNTIAGRNLAALREYGDVADVPDIETMALHIEAGRGTPLTDKERAGLEQKHAAYVKAEADDIKANEKALNDSHNEAVAADTKVAHQEVKAEKAAEANKTQSAKQAEKAQKRAAFQALMDQRAEEALKAFREKMNRSNSDFAALAAMPEVLQFIAAKIAKGTATVANLIEDLVTQFGITDKEAQKTAIENAQKLHDQQAEEFNKKPEATPESIVKSAASGKLDAATVKALYKAHIKENLKKPLSNDELAQRVHADAVKIAPDVTERKTRDMYSEYGKIRKPSKDEVKREMARYRRLHQLASALEDVRNGKAPSKSGWTPGPKLDEIRQKEQELRDAMREAGIKTTRSEQLADAQTAVKTRLKNQLQDLMDALHGKAPANPNRKPIDWTPEMKAMAEHIQGIKEYLDELTGPSPESKWNTNAQKAAEASRKAYELKIKTNDFGRSKPGFEANAKTKAAREAAVMAKHEFERLRESSGLPAAEANARQATALRNRQAALNRELKEGEPQGPHKQGRPMSPENKIIKAENDRLSALLKWLHPPESKARDPLTAEQRSERAEKLAEKNIADLEKEIAGEAKVRPDNQFIPNAKLRALRAEVESLRGIRDAMRDAKITRRTPDQIATDQFKGRMRREIYANEQKLKTGDFSKKTPREIQMDADALRLKGIAHDTKVKVLQEEEKLRVANRSRIEKIAAAIQGWHTASVLSGVMGWIKLPAAAGARMVLTPLDQLAGSGIRKLVPELAAMAPRHGAGLNVSLEAKVAADGLNEAMTNWRRTLMTGHTRADTHSGKVDLSELQHFAGKGFADMVWHIHALLKSPAKEIEFARSVELRTQHEIDAKNDPNDWKTQLRIYNGAHADANEVVLKGANVFSSHLSSIVQQLRTSKKYPNSGKVLAAMIDYLAPIRTVPVNFVLEAYRRSPVGLAHSAIEAKRAYRQMADGKLAKDDADRIMMNLKRGTVGSAFWMLGYLVPSIAGGYYQQGEKKRRDEDLKPGDIGAKHTHILMHNAAAEALSMGATTRKIADHMLKGHPEGFVKGLGESFLGLIDQTPFIREPKDLIDMGYGRPDQSARAQGNLVQSALIPRGVTEIAQLTDPAEKRRMKTIPDYLKAGIPGLRETLPVRQ